MNTDKLKSNKIRLKSTNYLFQPIVSENDIINQRKLPSPFQTGFKYLKSLGQLKRQNENNLIDTHEIKPTIINRLERTSAFSTNYYAPLLPRLSSHLINKSIQVDDFDELAYKTTINYSYLSFHQYFIIFISFLFFILIIFFFQKYSYPKHCLLHKKYWYPIHLSNGLQCTNTNIEIYYVEIYSKIYQLEIQKNIKSRNCLGFHILSCLPIDYFSIPKQQIIRRNDELVKYCNHTQQIKCNNHSLSILPYEYKWNLKNKQPNELIHCSCLIYSNNNTSCFHFMINNECDLRIPWFDYCLTYSTTDLTCQAYVKKSDDLEN
ncbi:unnamed protein product [Adineta steineri]|uniref:Uncharacterized protein n=1 Tax=Adineta steineri TaxID=433720 RepID=A0A819CQD3_9BILA|nr:unnamed protein product [Adineta steineri]